MNRLNGGTLKNGRVRRTVCNRGCVLQSLQRRERRGFSSYPHSIMDWIFRRHLQGVLLEVRRGRQGADYASVKVQLGSLPKKDMEAVLWIVDQVARQVQ